MVTLFVAHIRPLLEYCSPLWNLEYLTDTRMLESVQRRWTKQIDGCENLDYDRRLRQLGLFSLQGRRLRADLIKIWKAFHPVVDVGLTTIFEFHRINVIRGYEYEIAMPVCGTNIRRRHFDARRVAIWNSLPGYVVGAESLDKFKRLLELELGDILYSYL